MKILIKTLMVAALALGLVLIPAGAQEKGSAKGGATKLMQPLKVVGDYDKLEAGDMVVMACPKCKSMTVTYVEKRTAKGTTPNMVVGEKHLCPGCQTVIEVAGHGKAKTDKVVHKCQKCGSEDAYCCVLKKGSGPAKGMEKQP